jgi:hypothetical protein
MLISSKRIYDHFLFEFMLLMYDLTRFIVAMIAIATVLQHCKADGQAPPWTYKKTSHDLRYLFVMIAPVTGNGGTQREISSKEAEIRNTYLHSGMYHNDGTAKPLWTVDWYAYDVDIASDGIHIVRWGSATSNLESEVISFFSNGMLTRSYSARDLVDIPLLLPRSYSHFQTVQDKRLDDTKGEYVLKTHDGNTFVFDLRTGEVIGGFRWARVIIAFAIVIGVLTILICVRVIRKRRTKGMGHDRPV